MYSIIANRLIMKLSLCYFVRISVFKYSDTTTFVKSIHRTTWDQYIWVIFSTLHLVFIKVHEELYNSVSKQLFESKVIKHLLEWAIANQYLYYANCYNAKTNREESKELLGK